MLLLFLLLWFIYIDRPQTEEEEGIEVMFGNAEDGGASEPVESAVETPSVPAPPAAVAPSAPSSNDLMTQEDEESLALQREQERKRKQQEAEALAEQRRKAAAEQAAREKALAEARAAAEAKAAAEKAAAEAAAAKAAKEQAAKDKAAAMGSLFGGTGSGTTSGNTQQGSPTGNSNKGNPVGVGHGTGSGGHSWSLAGRNLTGSLGNPAYNSNAEGVVVVKIRVNAAGNVISASVGQGTNTSDQQLINSAIQAAKHATFSAGDGDVIGSITYVFKLK